MNISVIVPVYNAEKFLRRAVDSALIQEETDEVILIEDGSTDSSLALCYKLRDEYDSIKLFRHETESNKGAGASRNLGIENACNEWIGFLDADDYFLPGRFTHINEILEKHPDCEAICDAVGVHYEDDTGKERWRSLKRESFTTLNGDVRSDNMYEAQLGLSKEVSGHCQTGGFTVSKKAIQRVGLFPEHLLLHQDTVLWAKLGAAAKMYPGKLGEPVAMRGVHQGNRITAPRSQVEIAEARMLMWLYLWRWGQGILGRDRLNLTLRQAMKLIENLVDDDIVRKDRAFKVWDRLMKLGLKEPRLFTERLYLKEIYSRTRMLLIMLKQNTY